MKQVIVVIYYVMIYKVGCWSLEVVYFKCDM